MRLYLDVCSLNRPFDDQSIDRNRLEAEAVVIILGRISAGRHSLVSSEAIDREVAACTDTEKVDLVRQMLRLAKEIVILTPAGAKRYQELSGLGFRQMDAFHLACAEAGNCAYLFTTDDKLLKRSRLYQKLLSVIVVNPLNFLTEVEP
jgi:predicted nucleic acid-binding protein